MKNKNISTSRQAPTLMRLRQLRKKRKHLLEELESSWNDNRSYEGLLFYQRLLDEDQLLKQHINNLNQYLISYNKHNHVKQQKCLQASIGCTVRLCDNQRCQTLTLVEQAHLIGEKALSAHSPLGKKVIGKRRGDRVEVQTPGGEERYTIAAICGK